MRRVGVSVALLACLLAATYPASAASPGVIAYSAYTGGEPSIWLISGSGGVPAQLSPGQGFLSRWAPGGSGLGYVGKGGGVRWIDADGTNDHLLVRASSLPTYHPAIGAIAWSPDVSTLLLSMWDLGYNSARLYTADAAKGHLHLLLKDAGGGDWASTGRILAIRGHRRLVTMDADTSHRTVILHGNMGSPRWSPDGTRIVLTRGVQHVSDVFAMDADGSDLTNLTMSPRWDWTPTWSPDGTQIAWPRSHGVLKFSNLFMMNADGSNRIRLTATHDVDEYAPDWTA